MALKSSELIIFINHSSEFPLIQQEPALPKRNFEEVLRKRILLWPHPLSQIKVSDIQGNIGRNLSEIIFHII